MLPLQTRGLIEGTLKQRILKVLTLEEALCLAYPLDRVMVDRRRTQVPTILASLASIGIGGILEATAPTEAVPTPILHNLANPEVVKPGDVIRLQADGAVQVLYRRGANANVLFVTERCNNYCLMCSQPPNPQADDWRIAEILDFIPLIDPTEPYLCITGGEPTLLGTQLAQIIEKVAGHLPKAQLATLTNGRHFSDPALVQTLAAAKRRMRWAIPLYTDSAARHDYVVQAAGAFAETVNGIYNLAETGHRIEIRYVVHAQTVERLEKFAEFLYRNFPFVEHVAFMGLEPMGFAKANRESLWVDPYDYGEALSRACWYLQDRGMNASIYNVPLCVLPKAAWPLAKMSISDWKNKYIEACEPCELKERCCGFFASFNETWQSAHIHALKRDGGIYASGLETVS